MTFTGTAGEARVELAGLVSPAVVPSLSDGDLDKALLQSRLKDSEGRLPDDEGWSGTWSISYAAYLVSRLRAVRAMSQDQIKRFTSEGSTFEREPVSWSRVADAFLADAASEAGLSSGGITVYGIEPTTCRPVPIFPHLTGVVTNAD